MKFCHYSWTMQWYFCWRTFFRCFKTRRDMLLFSQKRKKTQWKNKWNMKLVIDWLIDLLICFIYINRIIGIINCSHDWKQHFMCWFQLIFLLAAASCVAWRVLGVRVALGTNWGWVPNFPTQWNISLQNTLRCWQQAPLLAWPQWSFGRCVCPLACLPCPGLAGGSPTLACCTALSSFCESPGRKGPSNGGDSHWQTEAFTDHMGQAREGAGSSWQQGRTRCGALLAGSVSMGDAAGGREAARSPGCSPQRPAKHHRGLGKD